MPMTIARRDTYPTQPVYLPREGLDRTPVFHARGDFLSTGGADELRTRCGIVVYRYSRDVYWVDRTHLRLDHAEAIGIPCQRCWPPR